MYSLMISIISIALISAMALSSIYYGGASLNKGTTDADVAAIINQGQQIQGAITMANIDRNATAVSLATLVSEEYLQEAPTFDNTAWGAVGAVGTGTDAVATAGYSYIAVGDSVCHALNIKAGVADTDGVTVLTAPAGLFGCITTSDEAFYKVGSYYN